jgi:membrane-anchored protein YejM (alkaline phosphatase superfamily)
VDAEIGKVLKALEERGLADNSIIIITGDHGEEFNDNKKNFWGHGSNFTSAQIHVPLVIRWPGRGKQTFGHQTSHYDIVPTLMKDVFGCDSEFSGYTTGSHLFDEKKRPYLIIGGYYDYAVMEPAQIDIVTDGMLQIKDYRWIDIPGSVPDRTILSDSTNKLRMFLK